MFQHKMIRQSLFVLLTLCVGVALRTGPVYAGAGNVLPPAAAPQGYSLEKMATALAKFNDSQNNPAYYPNTPFQILYVDFNTGTNTFTVSPGTQFFVPILNASDSPPVVGTFPADAHAAVAYVFDQAQLGGSDFEVAVDGEISSVGPAYVAGPVFVPGLPNGGSHALQLGVFLTPLSPGTHTVTVSGRLNGDLLGNPDLRFAFTYTVSVSG